MDRPEWISRGTGPQTTPPIHGHQFGLPALIDVESEALALLDKKFVRDVQVFAETAGVTIWFEVGQRLEAINNAWL